jgi:hypothetical protein
VCSGQTGSYVSVNRIAVDGAGGKGNPSVLYRLQCPLSVDLNRIDRDGGISIAENGINHHQWWNPAKGWSMHSQ